MQGAYLENTAAGIVNRYLPSNPQDLNNQKWGEGGGLVVSEKYFFIRPTNPQSFHDFF